MKFRYFLFVLPLLTSTLVGCGRSSDSTVLEPAPVVSPIEEEIKTDDYAKGMESVGK